MHAKPQTLSEMAASLNRSVVYLAGLQKRFALPVLSGAAYSPAYLAFLRALTALRSFDVAEETLRDLWQLEKKLLHLLHVDTTGSPTWFLDSCGQTTEMKRRLLLTNHDLGVEIHTRMLQPDLNFAVGAAELFAGREMGEDALRVLGEYIKLQGRVCAEVQAERPLVREALEWTKRLKPRT
ncbi:MAG: hypothetical protein EBS84_01960 [Proteobacteria bacterium]|nr:hypothetical protein [Verrucomicrobiota bacterium]NBU07775.1 hypothetical protein [Pseudomonadota bacterium]